MSNLKITDLKKYLKTLSEEELRNEIVALAKNYKEIKNYYNIKINPENEEEILEKYKSIIKKEFFPDRGSEKMRYKVVKDAIKDYKKISNNHKNIADLMLYYTEIGVKFTNEFGDIDERFYTNIENAYEDALKYIFENKLEEEFNKRAKEVVENINNMGWGFKDSMNDNFYYYYVNYDD
ncbi:MAG: DUF6155 family protein [Tepidibacter sp.]|jgi:hypothetical protein|uniref:DUF6155 family protein n=1 Tax=Tepidibacter sp. TaxID=2529387 RepID=UPI0025F31BCA|nr:DUF6155 family protein [Tepidibacter sp.]MCT4509768.1 DUF6155 family protein [Tepidibacter sp.]